MNENDTKVLDNYREGVMQTKQYIKWFLNTRQLDPV